MNRREFLSGVAAVALGSLLPAPSPLDAADLVLPPVRALGVESVEELVRRLPPPPRVAYVLDPNYLVRVDEVTG